MKTKDVTQADLNTGVLDMSLSTDDFSEKVNAAVDVVIAAAAAEGGGAQTPMHAWVVLGPALVRCGIMCKETPAGILAMVVSCMKDAIKSGAWGADLADKLEKLEAAKASDTAQGVVHKTPTVH